MFLLQETKLTDVEAPVAAFHEAGYELTHHGQGQWNGVAIASRVGIQQVIKSLGLTTAAEPQGEEEAVSSLSITSAAG